MANGLFLIDETRRKKFALWGIIINLMFLHVWASILIARAAFGNKKTIDGETIQLMFSSIMTAIGVSLFVLISDKAIDFIIHKFGGSPTAPPQQVTETVTRTVIPATAPVANDVNIKAEGDVNVQS